MRSRWWPVSPLFSFTSISPTRITEARSSPTSWQIAHFRFSLSTRTCLCRELSYRVLRQGGAPDGDFGPLGSHFQRQQGAPREGNSIPARFNLLNLPSQPPTWPLPALKWSEQSVGSHWSASSTTHFPRHPIGAPKGPSSRPEALSAEKHGELHSPMGWRLVVGKA